MSRELLLQRLAMEALGNTLRDYAIALGVFLAVILGVWIVKKVVVGRLRRLAARTSTDLDDFLVGLFRHVGPLVYVLLALFLATRSLHLSESIERILHIFFVIVLTFKAIQIGQESIRFFLEKWVARADPEDPNSAAAAKHIVTILRIALWAAGAVFVLDNLEMDVTGIVTTLGIGGVAVALAAQAVLGDAFSSFAIFMDKPFKVGDFIIVGDLLGTVEHVGFKTTRIRSLGGEQLILANSDLTSSRIRNYKQMKTRRIVFGLGVVYQTPVEEIQAIPGIVEEIVRSHDLTRFDRAHFKNFGDFALVFEFVYHVLSPGYNEYMDVQQYINVRIMKVFAERKIEFAYPTQQLFVTSVQPPA